MSVIIIKTNKKFKGEVSECQNANLIMLKNGDTLNVKKVCWGLLPNSVIAISETKTYKIKLDTKNMVIIEYEGGVNG